MSDKPIIYVNLKITKEEHPELYEFLRDMPTKWAVETALYRWMNEAKNVLTREPVQGQAATPSPSPDQTQPQEQKKQIDKKIFKF